MADLIQVFALVLLAPLAQGMVQRVKAALQGRRGAPVYQPYLVFLKLLRRGAVWPEGSGPVMRLAPIVTLAATLVAAAGVPLFAPARSDELLVVLFALALARFALALGALDTGTPFAGLGSSREMTVGALVEPVLLASALPFLVAAGTTAWPALLGASAHMGALDVVRLAAFGGLFLAALAETGRLPVDNPDTHLELTMIHEAQLLEYSGPPLAVVSLAVWVKQLALMAFVADLAWPWGMGASPDAVLLTLAKWTVLALALGIGESLTAKIRFLRVPAYLGTAFAFSVSAVMLQVVGVR